MKPIKNEKMYNQQKQTTNESNKKFKTAGLAWMLRGPHVRHLLFKCNCDSACNLQLISNTNS